MAVTNFKEYVKPLSPAHREMMAAMRKIILEVAPRAKEKISWGMPMFELEKDLCGIAAFTNHCSLFPASGSALAAFEKDLRPYKSSKGTVQFQLDEKLPLALIKKLVKFRVAENLQRASVVKMKDGKKHGKAREFYADGTLKAEGSWREGELHGKWNWYRADGTLMRSGSFKAGAQTGEWTTYERNGRVVKVTRFE